MLRPREKDALLMVGTWVGTRVRVGSTTGIGKEVLGEGQPSMMLVVVLAATVVTVVSKWRLVVFGDASPAVVMSSHCRSTLVTVGPSAGRPNETSCRCVLVTVPVAGEVAAELPVEAR